METYFLLDENSGFVAEVPEIIPIIWRYKNTIHEYVSGSQVLYSTPGGTPQTLINSVNYTNWQRGGNPSITRQVCRFQNPSGFGIRELAKVPNPYVPGAFIAITKSEFWRITDGIIEIDWEATLAGLRAQYNPEFYAIGAIRFTNVTGTETFDLVKEGVTNLDTVNSIFQDTNNIGSVVSAPLLEPVTDVDYVDYTVPYGQDKTDLTFKTANTLTVEGVSKDDAGIGFSDSVKSLSLNSCTSNSRGFQMYLKVWVKDIVAFGGGTPQDPEETQQTNDLDSDPSSRLNQRGSGISGSSLGSSSQGLNTISTLYGNSNLPFDSVFLTGSNYNSFVSAGGGIISPSGVFPKSDTLYIDKVSLSIEGSTMSVIEVVKFDEEPSLILGQKIYGYIFDATHVNKPSFTGYVISRKRKLNDNTQEITYECRDISYFFGQMYSPSAYILSTGVSTYSNVLKDILNVAGIPNASISLPDIPSPEISWYYEPLDSILNWSTKYFGKHVSYIDRYGILNVRATDSGSFIKNIPIPLEGTPVKSGDYRLLDFDGIADNSRSRSRIILTGDFSLHERESIVKYKLKGPVNPSSGLSNGFYWYYKTLNSYTSTRFFYFVLRTGNELINGLLSNPGLNASVNMSYTINQSGVGFTGLVPFTSSVSLDIISFQSSVSGSVIVAALDISKLSNGSMVPFELLSSSQPGQAVTGTQEYTFTVRYAYKESTPIQMSVDTGLPGGTEIVKRPEFRYVSGAGTNSIDDRPLMSRYLSEIRKFYTPIYGGSIQKDGLDLDLELLGKVSITGTGLPSIESNNLIIYGIEYDVSNLMTTVELSNKVYLQLPFFDVIRDDSRSSHETRLKVSTIEQNSSYNKVN